VELAKTEKSPWNAFGHLRKALGDTTWIATIRNTLQSASTVSIPQSYLDFWELGVNGFFTLNLDRLASRAFSECFAGRALREFNGTDSHSHSDVLRSGHQFVANLHGTLENDRSWVLTQPDFENLCRLPAYRSLVQSCFASRIVLFAGVSADDQAAGGHLLKLQEAGVNLGGHYWLTNRNDQSTDTWAEKAGLNRIYYAATEEDHSEFTQFIKDLKGYLEPVPKPPVFELAPVRRRGGLLQIT